jgi:UDP-N-acetylmuramoyl-tripeptide--D-alanyl-D-alanine ligase
MTWALVACSALATVPAGLRWLRVSQREHYLAPAVTRFAARWWMTGVVNPMLFAIAMIGVVGSAWSPWFAFLVVLAQIGPIGLGLRGRTSPLAWTGRLRRMAGVVGGLVITIYLVAGLLDLALLAAGGLLLLPGWFDLALVALGPVEKRVGGRWVDQAAARLKSSRVEVVAITGSYGKTTTKQYVAHLLSDSRRVVASPASFNNRMGLARAINEQLVPGTEVFVAEMGTYGPGEIAELCAWISPKVAAIVALGPVHLERFRSEDRIVLAKAEILDRAEVGVIAVDHPLLSDLAVERERHMEVITVSGAGGEARVTVRDGSLHIAGVEVARLPDDVFEVNLAVAVGIGLALGVDQSRMISRISDLPRPEHRQTVTRSEKGFSIIDDTYNSNPAGARSALRRLAKVGAGGRIAMVTPGMVEMGPIQFDENRSLAVTASELVDHLVIVGRTNRRALLDGSGSGKASVTVVASRQEAVDWVRQNLGPGDSVLYENDLPDHYP